MKVFISAYAIAGLFLILWGFTATHFLEKGQELTEQAERLADIADHAVLSAQPIPKQNDCQIERLVNASDAFLLGYLAARKGMQ